MGLTIASVSITVRGVWIHVGKCFGLLGLFKFRHGLGNGVHLDGEFSITVFVLRHSDLHGLTGRHAVNTDPRPVLHSDEWIVTRDNNRSLTDDARWSDRARLPATEDERPR